LLVKIAPDLTKEELADIASVALETKVDGIIVSNTTVSRSLSLQSGLKDEAGGLSGVPLFNMSTETLKEIYKLTGGRIPLIGVGGIFSGKDAYEKIKAGASLIQIHTSLVYLGPAIIPSIKRELAALLKADGYTNISEAVCKSINK